MPSLLSSNKRYNKYAWCSCFLVTFAVCGVLLYAAYILKEVDCTDKDYCSWFALPLREKLHQKDCRHICTTKECITEADNMLSYMNLKSDPCHDFYSFICGKWQEQFGKNDNASIIKSLRDILHIQIKDVILNTKEEPGGAVEKMKIIYDSCISHNASELMAVPSIKKFLARIGIPNWPHLGEDFKFSRSFEEVLAQLIIYNEFSFFEMSLTSNLLTDNVTDEELQQLQPLPMNVSVSRAYTKVDDDEERFYDILIPKILIYLGMDETSANETSKKFLELEAGFGNISKTARELRYPCFENRSRCAETEFVFDCINEVNASLKMICKVIHSYMEIMGVTDVISEETIEARDPYYLNRIFPYLTNYTEREIAHYLALRFILKHIGELSMHFISLESQFSQLFYGNKFHGPRWKYCVNWVSDNMPAVLSYEYFPKVLPKEARDEIDELFKEVKEGYLKVITSADWISTTMKSQLSEKVNVAINYLTNYTDFVLNETSINIYYSELHPTNESFLYNILEFQKMHHLEEYVKAGLNVRRYMYYTPFIVNAMYNPESVSIELLLGVLLPPLFVHGRSKLLNIGALGPLVGHEFGHVMGHFFKQLKNEDIDDETRTNYENRQNCLIAQYSDFEIENIGEKLNGTVTFQDDLADHLGMILAHKIYKKHTEQMGIAEFDLPALNFTTEQKFYISQGQTWCSISSKEEARQRREYDNHSPPNFRVIGVIQNMEEFAEAFKCHPGTPMNPRNKCSFVSK